MHGDGSEQLQARQQEARHVQQRELQVESSVLKVKCIAGGGGLVIILHETLSSVIFNEGVILIILPPPAPFSSFKVLWNLDYGILKRT